MENSHFIQTNCISCLSIEEIQTYQFKNQSLIVPLGGLEPFGSTGAAGIPGLCSEILAHALASKCESMVAPSIPFSSSPAFKAFPGCAALGSDVYENVLINLCKSWNYQGFTKVLLVNSAFMPDHSLEMVMKRLGGVRKNGEVRLFSWQSDKRMQKMIHTKCSDHSFERFESALLSIALYLKGDMIRGDIDTTGQARPSEDEYKRWRKRGCDPQKYRKLFNSGISSVLSSESVDSDLGETLFKYILECMIDDYSTYLRAES